MNNIGVVFDFNGTLFHDSDKHEKAWRQFFKTEFKRDVTDEEFRKYVHGRNGDFTLKFLSGKPLTDKEVSSYLEIKEEIYRELCLSDKSNFHLATGAEILLDELKERNIPITIATASQLTNLKFYIESFNLTRWFDVDKIVYDDGTVLGKPNPDYYIKASKEIATLPQNCIVFEDAISGIQAAYSAGIGKIIAVTSSKNESTFQNMVEVYDVIHNFHDFDRFLLRP